MPRTRRLGPLWPAYVQARGRPAGDSGGSGRPALAERPVRHGRPSHTRARGRAVSGGASGTRRAFGDGACSRAEYRENRYGEQKLQACREWTGAVPAVIVEELPSTTRAQEREDVLEVGARRSLQRQVSPGRAGRVAQRGRGCPRGRCRSRTDASESLGAERGLRRGGEPAPQRALRTASRWRRRLQLLSQRGGRRSRCLTSRMQQSSEATCAARNSWVREPASR